MEPNSRWLAQRQQWIKPTKPYTGNDIYKDDEIDYDVYEDVKEIVKSTKPPYPPFKKKIPLHQLATIINKVLEEEDND